MTGPIFTGVTVDGHWRPTLRNNGRGARAESDPNRVPETRGSFDLVV